MAKGGFTVGFEPGCDDVCMQSLDFLARELGDIASHDNDALTGLQTHPFIAVIEQR